MSLELDCTSKDIGGALKGYPIVLCMHLILLLTSSFGF